MALDASPLGRERADEDDGLRPLALACTILAAVVTGASVLTLVPVTLSALQYAADERVDQTVAWVGLVTSVVLLGALLPAWIVTALWLRAVHRRLEDRHQLHFNYHTLSAFLSWVVPLANLFWPLPVVRELHHAAVEGRRRVHLNLWWGCWLGAFLTGWLEPRLVGEQQRGDPAATTIVWSCVATAFMVVAFVQWLRIVRTTTEALR